MQEGSNAEENVHDDNDMNLIAVTNPIGEEKESEHKDSQRIEQSN